MSLPVSSCIPVELQLIHGFVCFIIHVFRSSKVTAFGALVCNFCVILRVLFDQAPAQFCFSARIVLHRKRKHSKPGLQRTCQRFFNEPRCQRGASMQRCQAYRRVPHFNATSGQRTDCTACTQVFAFLNTRVHVLVRNFTHALIILRRILANSSQYRDDLVRHMAPAAVAKLLPKESIQKAALQALACITQSCTVECAMQVPVTSL